MSEWRFPTHIDNTMLKDWRRCPQYFMRRHCQGLQVKEDEVSIDLHFGAAFAKAIEVGRRHFFEVGGTASTSLDAALWAATQAYGTRAAPPRSSKTLPKLLDAVCEYFRHWPMDEDTLVPVDGGIEYAFEIDLPIWQPATGNYLKYCGRMDMLACDKTTGDLVVVDEKTASRFTDAWMAQWDMDTQLSGYIYAASLCGDMPDIPNGVIRGIGINSQGIDCVETSVSRTRHQIDLWEKQTFDDIDAMVDAFNCERFDYRMGNSCTSYARACEYTRLCTTPNPDAYLEQYEVRFWNPVNRESEKVT